MKHKITYITAAYMLLFICCRSQNYHAVNGSMYAGSLAPSANPAAIIFVPYTWDVTPLALQFKQSTNAFSINNFSFLSPSGDATAENSFGIKKRFFFATQDVRLLNTRINLNDKSAIAFGANVRSYIYGTSGKSNYQDTTFSLADFQRINLQYLPQSFGGAAAAWTEIYASYARTMVEDGHKIINAAVTLKYNRSVAGAYVVSKEVNYIPDTDVSNANGFLLTAGSLQYGYSSNIDLIKSGNSISQNRQALLQGNNFSFGADAGIEYIFLPQDDNDEEEYYYYKTKLGIAVMDIGGHSYSHSTRSRVGTAVKAGVNDTILENKFTSVRGIDEFNDSLATISSSLLPLQGNFVVYSPTRLVVNIDKRLQENIFVNAELTLPLIRLATNSLIIKDINLLAITPRWENRTFGAYLPLLVNMRKQVWIGGAFRAGPLLLGVHNFANVFGKNSMQNGGMYLALTIRPGKKNNGGKQKGDPEKRRQLKKLNCVSF
jgi:hypothetical protein